MVSIALTISTLNMLYHLCDMTDAINYVTCNQPGELQVTNVTCNSLYKQTYAK